MNAPKFLVIDLGSQLTLVIGRILRELGYRSAILSPKKAEAWLMSNRPAGIILSGGPASVNDPDAPMPPRGIWASNVPILGICYGMQVIAREIGGVVSPSLTYKHYGPTEIKVDNKDRIFVGLGTFQCVWMSHGDSVHDLPKANVITIGTAGDTIAAIRCLRAPWWGLQFHPEAVETSDGRQMLENFVGGICQGKKDWSPPDVITEIRSRAEHDCADLNVLGGFSGGVDSSALLRILAPVMGKKLRAVCIDGGQLRLGELEEIERHAKDIGVSLKIVSAQDRFLDALGGISNNGEGKRQAFRGVYKAILEEEARDFGAGAILQGSLATDFIESGQHGGSGSDMIKTHHNIGLGLSFPELHPFKDLFKYEVRELARTLGLPASISERQPFPGPGLFIRIIGGEITSQRLDLLRWADAKVTEILRNGGVYSEMAQLVVALLCTPTVGVKGDGRSYSPSFIVRGVKTSDYMTASGYQIPAEVRRLISQEVTKHPDVVRVFFDETDKPPATTEME